MQEQFAITLTWRDGYEFEVDFEQEGVASLITDEPPPLGDAVGPNPARLLAAAVGNCLSASFRFCLERARIEVQGLKTTVEGRLVRNERGRLRIGSLRVRLEPTLESDAIERIGRCLDVFEDFCIVGQSVRDGIDIDVEVVPAAGPVAAAAGRAD
ncbi:MAG TPA: OsmC family protein [Longimicrobiales bacterium]